MIPYQGIISLTFVVFPLLSEATFNADKEKTEKTIQGALRFAILLVAFLCGGLVLTDNVLIGILFGAPYQVGVVFLIPMVAGTVTFALYVVLTSLLTAAGYPGRVLGIGAICTLIHLSLVAGATQFGETPYEAAVYAAWASALGPCIGFCLAAFFLRKTLKVRLPWASAIRGVGCAAAAAIATALILSKVSLVSVALRLALFMVLVLTAWVLTGELSKTDLKTLRKLLSRKGN
jgi:stage V sporulation protein B